MPRCPACRETVPEAVRYCGFCGFKLAPISLHAYEELSANLRPPPARGADEAAPLLLTKRKRPSEERRDAPNQGGRPRLEIVDEAEIAQALAAQTASPASSPPSAIHTLARGAVVAPSGVPLGALAGLHGDGETIPQLSPPAPWHHRPGVLAPPANGRRFPRFPLKIDVSYTSDHNFYTGFMENLSSGGLFVATHTPAAIGDVLELSFSVPGLQRVCTAVCRVTWMREYSPQYPETVPGMGLQFSQLDPDARAAIEIFLRHRDPIFFDDE